MIAATYRKAVIAIVIKARIIAEDGSVSSYWSAPRRFELPDRPEAPTISVEPAVYGEKTPWVQVRWTDAGADKWEIEVFDGDGAFQEGDLTGELSIRYRPNNETELMKFRVRSADAGHSAWSTWGYARRSTAAAP